MRTLILNTINKIAYRYVMCLTPARSAVYLDTLILWYFKPVKSTEMSEAKLVSAAREVLENTFFELFSLIFSLLSKR